MWPALLLLGSVVTACNTKSPRMLGWSGVAGIYAIWCLLIEAGF
jgi:hypothetical protein